MKQVQARLTSNHGEKECESMFPCALARRQRLGALRMYNVEILRKNCWCSEPRILCDSRDTRNDHALSF